MSAPGADPEGPPSAAECASPAAAAGEAAMAPSRPHAHGLLPSLQSLLSMLAVALFFLTFTVQPFRIPSGSMEPTLLVGDFLLVEKQVGPETSPHIFAPLGEIRRGDVVVFHFPVDASMHLVKRVIGLPGDRIRLHEGRVYVNGRALDEPYAIYEPAPADSYRDEFPRMDRADPGVDARWWAQMRSHIRDGELLVPPESYFVLGDNRNDSEDSRYWGFVPRDAIVGKPVVIYFSLNSNPDTPGETQASALPEDGGSRPQNTASSVLSFARWDRVMRVVR